MITVSELYTLFLRSGRVTTDSRAISGGEIFFALKGENFDGNEYAAKALEQGASYAVVSADSNAASQAGIDSRIIPVDDTLMMLKDLARHHRLNVLPDGRHLPVIGLTGTNGKTTTKELIRAVLSRKYRVTATEGNLNNEIGVPLSLLKITQDTEMAVIEMGASHPGDIRSLVSVSMPDYGLITNVGKGHLLGFGSLEGVRKTKGELYDFISGHGGSIFLNEDLEYLKDMASARGISDVIPYGVDYDGAEILPPEAGSLCLRMRIPVDCAESEILETHLVGAYNADNVMAALAVGRYFGVPVEDSLSAIRDYVPSNNRSQMQKTEKNTIVVDAYNANPVSMAAALSSLEMMPAENKTVMLGDMLELGPESVAEHVNILSRLADMKLSHVFLVGSEFGKALKEYGDSRFLWFSDSAELAGYVKGHPLAGNTILLKGSRGTRMEKVIPEL